MAHRQPEVAAVGRSKIALAAALAIWTGIAGLTGLSGLVLPGFRCGVRAPAEEWTRDCPEGARCYGHRRQCLQHAARLAVDAQQRPESREPGSEGLQVPRADQSAMATLRRKAPPDLPVGAQTVRDDDGQAREGDHRGAGGTGRSTRVDQARSPYSSCAWEYGSGLGGPRVGANEGEVGGGAGPRTRCSVPESLGRTRARRDFPAEWWSGPLPHRAPGMEHT